VSSVLNVLFTTPVMSKLQLKLDQSANYIITVCTALADHVDIVVDVVIDDVPTSLASAITLIYAGRAPQRARCGASARAS
jgi:hypothetical protein